MNQLKRKKPRESNVLIVINHLLAVTKHNILKVLSTKPTIKFRIWNALVRYSMV